MPHRILLVEDDTELRREILEYLRRRSHTVADVGTSTEARNLLVQPTTADEAFDVVLCDLNLGDGDGFDLFVECAPLHPSSHWILMSGDPDAERLEAAHHRLPGAPRCTIVSKPISLRNLAALASAGPKM